MLDAPDNLARLRDLVERGSGFMGIFGRSAVPKMRALELIDALIESLPEEMDQAREMVLEREELLEKARRQAGAIIDEAVRKAERLVDADAITVEARKKSQEMEVETDKYISTRLQDLELELLRLLKEVRAGIRAVGSPVNPGHADDKDFSLDNL
jgi:hypothetical protein